MIEAKTKTERRRVIMEKRIRDQKGAKNPNWKGGRE